VPKRRPRQKIKDKKAPRYLYTNKQDRQEAKERNLMIQKKTTTRKDNENTPRPHYAKPLLARNILRLQREKPKKPRGRRSSILFVSLE
jgi:hypothetical protein